MITETAQKMVRYGHAETIGVYGFDDARSQRQTEAILKEALEATEMLLGEHKPSIMAVASLLYRKGTCPGDEIHALLDRPV